MRTDYSYPKPFYHLLLVLGQCGSLGKQISDPGSHKAKNLSQPQPNKAMELCPLNLSKYPLSLPKNLKMGSYDSYVGIANMGCFKIQIPH